jgi:hypothetical protein
MDKWSYEVNRGGVPFIATGMNLHMMNDARYEKIKFYNKHHDIKNEIDLVIDRWESRKRKWTLEAQRSESIQQYLFNNFYK